MLIVGLKKLEGSQEAALENTAAHNKSALTEKEEISQKVDVGGNTAAHNKSALAVNKEEAAATEEAVVAAKEDEVVVAKEEEVVIVAKEEEVVAAKEGVRVVDELIARAILDSAEKSSGCSVFDTFEGEGGRQVALKEEDKSSGCSVFEALERNLSKKKDDEVGVSSSVFP